LDLLKSVVAIKPDIFGESFQKIVTGRKSEAIKILKEYNNWKTQQEKAKTQQMKAVAQQEKAKTQQVIISSQSDTIQQNMLKNKIKDLELSRQELELSKQTTYRNFSLTVSLFIIILAAIIYSRYVNRKRTGKIIEEKNNKLEEAIKIIRSDIEVAIEYINSLLPEQISNKYFHTSWLYKPSENLGGDIFGYHWLDEANFAIYLLDVSGHGVGAALHSVTALNALKNENLPDTDFKLPSQVLSGLNKIFQMSDYDDKYFTMWYGVYNIYTYDLTYACAGHPPPFCIDNTGKTIKLVCENFFIGGTKEFDFKSETIKINKPAKIYIYSDGAYEIKKIDGGMMTIDDMINYIKANEDSEGSELQGLFEHIINLQRNEILEDDFTLLKVVIE